MITLTDKSGKVVLDFGGAEVQVDLKKYAVLEALDNLDVVSSGSYMCHPPEQPKTVRVWSFLAKKDPCNEGIYIFALNFPKRTCGSNDYFLPQDFEGRGAFSARDITQIIAGLTDLIKK